MMREYLIEIAGIPHTVQLDDAEAARLGVEPYVRNSAPATKARTRVRNKGA
ncbi:hypothetical protein [Rhodococcus sp. BE178]|uniref:hypothetical protein n=1 Tax=Rhodococcus sp. BE178 TaxID=2817737 RepID=UPI003D1EEA84